MVASTYTFAELARIAHMEACRDLSDLARGQVSTYGEGYRRSGDLVEEAARLVGQAQEVMRLAVAAERAESTPWERIGEALETSKQAVHGRYAAAVEEIHDGILFPSRTGANGGLGWWACPDGLEDPERTVRRLDGWAVRHRERTDPERGERPVSENLRRRQDLASIETVGLVARIARRIGSGALPQGISEREAWRVLLEHKLRAFDTIAERDTGQTARDAAQQVVDVRDQLLAWHREDLEPRLTVDPVDDPAQGFDAYRFLLGGRPVAELGFSAHGSEEDTGWFLVSIDPDVFAREPENPFAWMGDPWPVTVDGVDIDALLAAGQQEGREVMLARAREISERTRSTALLRGRAALVEDLASDRVHQARATRSTDPSPAS